MAAAVEMLNTDHKDMIHDAQYDFYGRYLATCSSDGAIKIFELCGGGQAFLAELVEHSGPVWSVAWGYPKFGCTLASCGYDGKVFVWQEKGKGSFERMYTYSGHKSSVNGISWAPSGHGAAMLACCSSDSSISVHTYQTHGAWEVALIPNAHHIGCNCVAWEPVTVNERQRLVTGGADNMLKVWVKGAGGWEHETNVVPTGLKEYPEWVRDVAFCPSPVAATSKLACCSGHNVYIWQRKDLSDNKSQWNLLTTLRIPDLAWRLSWSEHESLLAVTAANNNTYIYKNVSLADPADWQQISVHPLNQPFQ
eukprot:TRINITY_DN10701_c0_g1_i2.p1 TRINITY_DN10701_c0_g1~~TRINITY_DN10701_c0_g1_i2.p1  ORF type:complete len:325 (+),score=85.61 TRINITY_DN10701_c0_g1_i2:52-975(+)